MSTTCPACNGKRTYTVTVSNVRKYGGVEYVSSIQPTKELVYVCDRCHGSGVIRCRHCEDTGWLAEYDYVHGEPEGLRPCDYCDKGRIIAETQAIDAEKEAHEATRPDYTHIHNERTAAGLEPY